MKDYITKLLNIDPSRIENLRVVSGTDYTNFIIELVPDYPECPKCGGPVKIHGKNKPKVLNHPKMSDEKCTITFISKRYMCKHCFRTFSEPNPFSFTRFRNTYFSLNQILIDLANLHLTYKDVADKNHVSPTSVQTYADSFLVFPRQTLPENIGIDEIHSEMAQSKKSKFICVMVDNINRVPFEILPSRSKDTLCSYFGNIPREERLKVKYFTMDMWEAYKDVAEIYLPNAEIAVDPFHVVEHLEKDFHAIRINIQNKVEYGSDAYYLLKHWKGLLEHHVFLDNNGKYNSRFKKHINKRDILNMILDINENLSLGYRLKEMYLDFNDRATPENAREWFDFLYETFSESQIPEYDEFVNLMAHWKEEIIRSFNRPYENRKQSNALSETINGNIGKYLSVSNGIINFTRFRKRVLYALNHRIMYVITEKLRTDKYKGKERGPYNK